MTGTISLTSTPVPAGVPPFIAGIDLGGTAVNVTILDANGTFLIDGLCEHPARSVEGPAVCLRQIAGALQVAVAQAGVSAEDIVAIGLDTPGPATAAGVLSQRGSTNFVHPDWAGFDIRGELEQSLGLPVHYLNDGNAAAVWGHAAIFGDEPGRSSVSAIIGTGLGGGVIEQGRVIAGSRGFGGELGHVLIPVATLIDSLPDLAGLDPRCNCGRRGDLESLCSLTAIRQTLLPHFLKSQPDHLLATLDPGKAATRVRGLAAEGDELCQAIFRVQARALGLFFDQMINVFDPDALIVGGGAIEAAASFQQWFLDEIRQGFPAQREEQREIPLKIMPNGDTAGARGAAFEARRRIRSQA